MLSGCSGSGGGTAEGEVKTGGNFVLLKTTPVNGGRVFLNDALRLDFSNKVDLDSANLNTVAFTVLDGLGNPVSELVSGNFQLDASPGDTEVGRRLLFVPHFATNNEYNDGGLRSGRTYLVHLVGGTSLNGTALRDATGKGLELPASFSFSTAEGTLPAQLFRNPLAGGPRRVPVGGLVVSTATSLQDVPLNLLGSPPVEVHLTFDQALNPHDQNVPVNFDSNPLVRSISNRGRIFLEYDDPEYGNNTWIPTDVELERNDINGATVVLRPVGVLPNNAEIRVIVENTVEDISGESNVANLAYNRVFGSFRTQRAYSQQFNAIVDSFTTEDNIDFGAPFPEPIADVGPGYLKAGFSFEGNPTSIEYEPQVAEVVLNTDFTQVVPKNGLPFNVSGGVFNFRNVRIPANVNVRGQGSNPMVWLISGDFKVEGTLTVRGGDGARVDTLNSANFAKAGGVGTCTGGNGGAGTPSGTRRDLLGATGNGPLQVPGTGGGGGRIACTAGCYTGSGYASSGGGSGGGGGTLATQGDPYYDTATYTGTSFQQKRGIGGAGCSGGSGTRTGNLAGGTAAPRVFIDTRSDNDFWGSGINLNTNLRITGEIPVPMGGGGGGGGGDTAHNTSCIATDPTFANDYSGGGGGGGGGVLIVKALGTIEITPTGKIIADGGNGGGGEQVGACGEAGGGGAGSGGMVILMSATKIKIHAHSTGTGAAARYTFRGDTLNANTNNINKDYNFAISADGGVCTTGSFQTPVVYNKYPASGQPVLAGASYDENPLGALGGLGIVQLMAPPGDNADGTNTVLDDNIEVVLPPAPPAGVTKVTMLGWRGFPDASGVYRDDFNNVIPVQTLTAAGTFGEGDIRPAPTFLPVPFNAKSRLRSKWLDTGVSRRRPIPADDGLPRGLEMTGNTITGPAYEFAGLDLTTNEPGYVHYEVVGSTGVKILYPTVVSPTDVAGYNAADTYLGSPAYTVDLAAAVMGSQDDRYRQYEAELLNASGGVVGSFRILSHTANKLWLAPDANALPSGFVRAQVRAKFFRIVTSGSEGLGPVYLPNGLPAVPNANVRIGFAFHQDPAAGPSRRYPLDPKQFVYDLNDQGLLNWIALPNNGAPRYVQWDVTFDMVYERNGTVAPSLSPSSPRPELHFLRIPFRF
jgi:hypothetical protein